MSPILHVALIGCGEVAQTIHLPTLLLCNDRFKTVAICDVSEQAIEHCASKFHVQHTYTDVGEMLSQRPEIDLVMILNANEYHAIHAIQCLAASKHVFIEKPMCLSHEDAQAIEAARVESGRICFVGYMRRYATAFLRVKEAIQGMEIKYVRVRDSIGKNAYFIGQGGHFPKTFSDIPPALNIERQNLSREIHTRAIGASRASDPRDVATWVMLGGLASHDLSAMRELVSVWVEWAACRSTATRLCSGTVQIGMPKRCLAATRSQDNKYITSMFEYDGFTAYYEMGIDDVRIFDAHIEVYGTNKHVKVTYDTPYIKGLPITATIMSTLPNGDHSEEIIRPTYEDAYTLEYASLYDAIVNGKDVKTNPVDADQDLKIFDMIMAAFSS